MAHARLSPSKAKRWMLCPASADREAAIPETERSIAADQGTNAHAVLEAALVQNVWPPKVDKFPYPDAGLPDELIEHAKLCYEYLMRRKAELSVFSPVALRAESKVESVAYTGRNDLKGTADAILVTDSFIEVVDLKTGGTLVDPDDPQLLIYALGVLAEYPNISKDTEIMTTVFQPKRPGANGIERTQIMTVTQLLEWCYTTLIPAASLTDMHPAPVVPGDTQCKYCKARNECPERTKLMSSAMNEINEVVSKDPLLLDFDVTKLTPVQISRALDAIPLLEARIKDIREHATKLAVEQGVEIDGYKVVRSEGHRAWAVDEEEMLKKLRNLKLKKDDYMETRLKSPAKLLKQKFPENVVASIEKLITRPQGAPQLVAVSDKRKAIQQEASVMFSPVVTETKPEQPALPDFLN